MNELGEILTELREIRKEILELKDEVRNFLGFFELDNKEVEELEKDVEAYRKGKLETITVDDLRKDLNP
jgi:hypothetical protein